jgi:hypothetical protein
MMRPDAKVEKVYLPPPKKLSIASQPPVERVIMVTLSTHLRFSARQQIRQPRENFRSAERGDATAAPPNTMGQG